MYLHSYSCKFVAQRIMSAASLCLCRSVCVVLGASRAHTLFGCGHVCTFTKKSLIKRAADVCVNPSILVHVRDETCLHTHDAFGTFVRSTYRVHNVYTCFCLCVRVSHP